MSEIKVVACIIATNQLKNISKSIKKILPFVDRYIVIDGGSQDESLIYLRNWASIEPKLNVFLHPWPNNFPKQRNRYIEHAKELCDDGNTWWYLVHDSDESYSDGLLENLKDIIKQAESQGVNLIHIQDQSVSMKGPKEVSRNTSQYWKFWLFKMQPETQYSLPHNPHEVLLQPNRKDGRVGGEKATEDGKDIFYYHIKQRGATWLHGFRNWLINGGGYNLGEKSKPWGEFRDLVKPYFDGIWPDDYQDIELWFLKGNLPQNVKDWLLNRARICKTMYDVPKNATDQEKEEAIKGASEVREAAKSYFLIWHPEELPEGITKADFK